MRPLLDIEGAVDGVCLRLDGEVLITGSWTHVTRARIVAYAALDRLDAIFRVENLHAQRDAS